jgi:TraX protein
MKTLASSHHLGTATGFVPQLSSSQQETLKWLAVVTMTLDHLNKFVFQSDYPALFWIGCLAFPLFAFLISYNLVVREVKPTRYLWPLILFAVVSQFVFMWTVNDTAGNILFTLYLGVLYIGLKPLLEKGFPTVVVHVLLVLILFIPSLQVQYGPAGVFLIPVLAAFLKRPTALGYSLTCFYLVALNTVSDSSVLAFFVSPAHGLYTTLVGLEPYTFIPLLLFPVVIFISRLPLTLTRANPWFFYAFYPAHLVALHLLAPYIS